MRYQNSRMMTIQAFGWITQTTKRYGGANKIKNRDECFADTLGMRRRGDRIWMGTSTGARRKNDFRTTTVNSVCQVDIPC